MLAILLQEAKGLCVVADEIRNHRHIHWTESTELLAVLETRSNGKEQQIDITAIPDQAVPARSKTD